MTSSKSPPITPQLRPTTPQFRPGTSPAGRSPLLQPVSIDGHLIESMSGSSGNNTHSNRISLNEATHLGKEADDGSVEYKWKLVGISPDRLEHLVTQMKFRLSEGEGECVYEIGVDDTGFAKGLTPAEFTETLDTLCQMAQKCSADVTVICEKVVAEEPEVMKCAEVMVRKFVEDDFVDLRIAICGCVGSGKSTLVGVLSRGHLDNGNGYARQAVFNHLHEVETGRTSSISTQIIVFDGKGNIVTDEGDRFLGGNAQAQRIAEKGAKIVTVFDLAGHERYLKTTLRGMTGGAADYACVVVSARNGAEAGTQDHLNWCNALKIPFFIVVTHIDVVDAATQKAVYKNIAAVVGEKNVLRVRTEDDVVQACKQLRQPKAAVIPVFLVSNVTGKSLDLIRKFLNLLPLSNDWEALAGQTLEVRVDRIFDNVHGVGKVVTGMVLQGSVLLNDEVLIGPDQKGGFTRVQIRSIQIKRVNVKKADAGTYAAFALTGPAEEDEAFWSSLRKGTFLFNPEASPPPTACSTFHAELKVLYAGQAGIQTGFQPMVHCHVTRQKARIVLPDNLTTLHSGQSAEVKIELMLQPECLKVGEKIVFIEGKTKGFGTITRLTEDKPTVTLSRRRTSSVRQRTPVREDSNKMAKLWDDIDIDAAMGEDGDDNNNEFSLYGD